MDSIHTAGPRLFVQLGSSCVRLDDYVNWNILSLLVCATGPKCSIGHQQIWKLPSTACFTPQSVTTPQYPAVLLFTCMWRPYTNIFLATQEKAVLVPSLEASKSDDFPTSTWHNQLQQGKTFHNRRSHGQQKIDHTSSIPQCNDHYDACTVQFLTFLKLNLTSNVPAQIMLVVIFPAYVPLQFLKPDSTTFADLKLTATFPFSLVRPQPKMRSKAFVAGKARASSESELGVGLRRWGLQWRPRCWWLANQALTWVRVF